MTFRALLVLALAFATSGCPGGSGGQCLPSTAPTISSVSPASGTSLGGTTVTITGTNLGSATAVTFGGTAATNVTPVNATTLTAETPAHAAEAVDVVVTTPSGSIAASGAFTFIALPTITSISPAAGTAVGGTAVTVTGTNLTGAISLTFDGTPASSLHVVNATTVTAVTPPHAAGAIDVVVTTGDGTATLTNGYTYQAVAVGQPTGGGQIACLGGGADDLITTMADTAASIIWAPVTTTTSANSDADGESNTTDIVTTIGAGSYAALRCDEIEIDSFGNSPCQTGNTCYTDWFLPAVDQLTCLYNNQADIAGLSAATYWTSTENAVDPTLAHVISMVNGANTTDAKGNTHRARCVRRL